MFDNSVDQTQDCMDSDKQQHSVQSTDNVAQQTQESWSLSVLKVPTLFCIGFLAYFLAFFTTRTLVEWQLVLTMVLGVVLTISIPSLYIENARITKIQRCLTYEYIYALLFVALAITPVLAGWVGRTTNVDLLIGLGAMVIILIPILYAENARVSSEPAYENSEIRVFINALIFVGFAIIVGSIGWISGMKSKHIVMASLKLPQLPLIK